MQYLPQKQTLMEAVVVFLASQVAPAVDDPGLRFRVKIAAHLLQVVYRELQLSDAHTATEQARLMQLTGLLEGDVHSLREAVDTLIADPATPPDVLDAIRAALMEGLAAQIAVSEPRFNTALDIEKP
ncbi:MAG: DUF6285 domain-containing protein [Myxococcota bacterium]|nr:DUF6285 domain-containing protein [Myxococcota bacterium]